MHQKAQGLYKPFSAWFKKEAFEDASSYKLLYCFAIKNSSPEFLQTFQIHCIHKTREKKNCIPLNLLRIWLGIHTDGTQLPERLHIAQKALPVFWFNVITDWAIQILLDASLQTENKEWKYLLHEVHLPHFATLYIQFSFLKTSPNYALLPMSQPN